MWSTDEAPVHGPRLTPEEQDRLQGMIEQAAVRAALTVGLPDEASRTIGTASLEGVRGVIEMWRQASDG
ncbi:hypothetical protein [Streptomyces sp. NPDC002573]|uniref:hypothetical protein n=1 Tax=Streptomyces sp. NPDC002573 TaxID=3364651 RepID=UPI0036BF4FA6